MTDFLNSLKADLLDRRLLPIVALVGVALVGAVAYAVLGGGGSTATDPGGDLGRRPSHRAPRARRQPGRRRTRIRRSPRPPAAPPHSAEGPRATPSPRCPAPKATRPRPPPPRASASVHGARAQPPGRARPRGGSGGTTPAPAKPLRAEAQAHRSSTTSPCCSAWLPPARRRRAPQLTPYENLKLLTPLPSVQAAADRLQRRRRRGQERHLHARRRSDPARRRGPACPAPRSARRSTCKPVRPSSSNTFQQAVRRPSTNCGS